MLHSKLKFMTRIISITLVFLMILALPVYAKDTVDSLEQSSSELESEISYLNSSLKELEKDITDIGNQMEDLNQRIESTQTDLAIAQGESLSQYTDMKLRIKYMYENGGYNTLDMLLSSDSITDFLKSTEFIASISEYDRNAIEKLEQTQKEIELQEKKLQEEQTSLLALQEELNQREYAISQKIDETSGELASVSKKLKEAKKEAEKAQATLHKPVEPQLPSDFNYAADATDIELFAALIECEAGSTNYEGMLAVASVVMNRVKHSRYPNTLREVIYQSGQFPPAHNGLVNQKLARGVKDSCVQVAKDALAGKNNVGDCLSFRSSSSGHAGTIIGDNVFF